MHSYFCIFLLNLIFNEILLILMQSLNKIYLLNRIIKFLTLSCKVCWLGLSSNEWHSMTDLDQLVTSLFIVKATLPHPQQWKRINHKQSARWQYLSWLKASAFFSLQKIVSRVKCYNLYLGLVTPSSGWWSPIEPQGTILFAEHHRMSWKYFCPWNIVQHYGVEFSFQNICWL